MHKVTRRISFAALVLIVTTYLSAGAVKAADVSARYGAPNGGAVQAA